MAEHHLSKKNIGKYKHFANFGGTQYHLGTGGTRKKNDTLITSTAPSTTWAGARTPLVDLRPPPQTRWEFIIACNVWQVDMIPCESKYEKIVSDANFN